MLDAQLLLANVLQINPLDRLRRSVRVVAAGAALVLASGCAGDRPVRESTACVSGPVDQGQVYLIRGLADVFSLGMDTLAKKLQQQCVDAETWRLGTVDAKRDLIESRYLANERRGPIVLLGHSFGADMAMRIAGALDERGIPVDLVVTFDPTEDGPVTDNVRKLINLHSGGDGIWKIVRAPQDFTGELVNVDVSRRVDLVDQSLNHFNLEKSPKLHDEVIAEILEIIRRNATTTTDQTRPEPSIDAG